ncbi:MAG: hypothetical protein OHK0015_46230 [Chloroflexi bacterium OHK40]
MSIDLSEHYTLLIYPFIHDLTPTRRAERLRALAPRWRPWWSRLDQAAMTRALDDSYFFLPYVRELLFPETSSLHATEIVRQQSQLGFVIVPGLYERHLAARARRDRSRTDA